ncbi:MULTISPECIES: ABC transporter permease [Burkholderia cepacia complex]|uniref:ABC transporter permease n=1 Tax=Burkholderia cepacia complex TaxID=87882 RepID=UPI000982018B|nr:ABC transporter permease [Burkholderia cenocepacia]AQQ28129.1 sugar ABC transporter permease [Burkholderia cenocepacia]ONV88069.1 sugar ABC transporter permease [Burkholderia cenocepacia]ONW12674.1 sugar ABC transporter permease [Burkholderia cenocepacia]ONW20465.1 sugar ABC transporter permease [Burkholderia cenocepacia]ONW30678.1 sugar ABC transporter permease [Burkholderia cenocepacia]
MKPVTSSAVRQAASVERSSRPGPARIRDALERTGILLVLAVLVVVFALKEPAFLNLDNLFSILQAVSIVALLGIGVTVTLAAGGFDLSVGSVAATAQMAASYVLVVWHGSAWAAVFACVVLGVAAGLFNGLLITRLRVPDQLATLGTLFLLAGLQLIPTGGRSLATGSVLPDGTDATGVFPDAFLALGRLRVFDVVPLPVLLLAAVTVLACVTMEATRWGRVTYAIGGNETAARLAGAPAARYRIAAYVVSGAIASLGGVLIAARVGRGDVSAGHSLLLDAVAAALIGYAVWGAKRPNVFGTVVGAVFVGVLLNGLTMLNAPYYMQDFIKGVLLVLALAFTFGIGRRADARA